MTHPNPIALFFTSSAASVISYRSLEWIDNSSEYETKHLWFTGFFFNFFWTVWNFEFKIWAKLVRWILNRGLRLVALLLKVTEGATLNFLFTWTRDNGSSYQKSSHTRVNTGHKWDKRASSTWQTRDEPGSLPLVVVFVGFILFLFFFFYAVHPYPKTVHLKL
jgi:hypothetical protein